MARSRKVGNHVLLVVTQTEATALWQMLAAGKVWPTSRVAALQRVRKALASAISSPKEVSK